jgi:general secretion pathway protein B
MSSILKALKKLETEKMIRLPDSVRIDSDILKSTDSPRRLSPMVSIALILLVFGGGSAATYYFMKEPKAPLATSKSQPDLTTQKLQPPPLVKTETLPAEIVVVPSTKSATEVPRIQPPKPVDTIKTAVGIVKKPTKAPVSGVSKKPTDPEVELHPAIAAAPALRVNGIAYQNSSTDSMAIVNGIPVSNGSTIEGSVVEEVRKDRVLFQRNGEKFEILLGQSNQ